ncbi:hypothetical protein [Streptomyces sp. NPDC050287]|uniref:hypothetical protein n=1 Tax=Streptomyces sp. NPDC050287 TaxID=3365608 RepID=UPI0037BD94ED
MNDGLLRPDLTAEDLVLFSGSLSQAALTTGDSHPGQGRRPLRISLDRLSNRNTAPLRVSVTGNTTLTAAGAVRAKTPDQEEETDLLCEVWLAPFADDPAVSLLREVHGLHRDLVAEVSADDHQVTAIRRALCRIAGNDGRRHRS